MNKTREERFLDIKKAIKTYEDYFFPSSCSNDLETPPIMDLQNQINELVALFHNSHDEILKRLEKLETHSELEEFHRETVTRNHDDRLEAIEKKLEPVSPSTPPVAPTVQDKTETYRIGQRFKIDGSEYLLAQVGINKVCMVCVLHGNRFREPVYVLDVYNITRSEVDDIGRSTYRNETWELIPTHPNSSSTTP